MAIPKPEDLTREKTLFALWRLSFKFKKRSFNIWLSLGVGLLLARFSFLSFDQPDVLIAAFRKIEATGLAFATSILGFLIAGFTVFVTVIRIEVFLQMARHEKSAGGKPTGESILKYNLSGFMVVFVHYIAYLFVCIVCELFLQPSGLASLALKNAATYPEVSEYIPLARSFAGSVLLVVFGTWTIYLALLLKSFVFNVYQVTVTAVRWEWEHPAAPVEVCQIKAKEGQEH